MEIVCKLTLSDAKDLIQTMHQKGKVISKKIKIVFFVHTYGLGGLENMVTNLVNALDPDLFECTILSFAPLVPLQNRVNTDRVRVVSLNKKGGNNPMLIYRIFRFLRSTGTHIVQTHNWGTVLEGILAAKLARVPAVIHAERGTIEGKKRNVVLQNFLWNYANQVLAVSNAHRQRIVDVVGFPFEKIRPIYNGVDSAVFFPRSEEKLVIRKKLGLNPEDICIGTVGSLRSVKNQALLLTACKKNLPHAPNMQIVLAGDGPLKKDLVAKAQALGLDKNVHFVGARNDIPEVLNAFDIFVLPSLREGMPNAVLEAMSCGVPVIATSVGGVPEVIEDNKSGILVPSQDEEALEAALADLIREVGKRRRLGTAGRRRVLAHFSLEKMVQEYHALYQSLVPRKGL